MKTLSLKKGEDKRIRGGHPWIFSNEINTHVSPLKQFTPGEEVTVIAHDGSPIGSAYVNPHSLIAARLYSRRADELLDQGLIQEKLSQALQFRSRLFSKPYYRLFFSEADELPGIVIDRFGHHLVVQLNAAGMEHKKELIKESLLSVIPDIESILLRNDSSIREFEGLSTYVEPLFGTPPQIATLEENAVRFTAPLWQGQKTGWFYDHRDNRARLERYVADRTVLDVFSYLGAFGLTAAHYGAREIHCIDASSTACDFITKNARLNHAEAKVTTLCNDAFDAMKDLIQAKRTFDVITLDPPAFVKKAKDRKEGMLAYQRINELALKLLNPNGILVSCSCSMHISMEDLTHTLQRASERAKYTIQILERGHQGPDHPIHPAIPETDYLKAIFVRKLD